MITVTEVDTLQSYLEGVISRADHHAQNVNRVALVFRPASHVNASGGRPCQ